MARFIFLGAVPKGRVGVRFVRFMIGIAVVAVGGAGTFRLLSDREAARLRRENEALVRRETELRLAIDRLSGEDRVAEVHVLDQVRPGDLVNGQPAKGFTTTIEFIELDRQQHPLPSQRFTINDEVIFFDALVLKFDAEKVAAGDPLRGKSLALFRRIYGEHQNPADGFPLDHEGDVPGVYRIEPRPKPFELELWSRFWDLARDPELARKQGVRVAQGEAVYVPMRRGQVWTLTLANNGGLNIKLHRPPAEATTRPPSEPAGPRS